MQAPLSLTQGVSLNPGYLYLQGALHAVQARILIQNADDTPQPPMPALVQSVWLGRLSLPEASGNPIESPGDAEGVRGAGNPLQEQALGALEWPSEALYVAHVFGTQTAQKASAYVLSLLARAHEVYKNSPRSRTRSLSYVAALMVRESCRCFWPASLTGVI